MKIERSKKMITSPLTKSLGGGGEDIGRKNRRDKSLEKVGSYEVLYSD